MAQEMDAFVVKHASPKFTTQLSLEAASRRDVVVSWIATAVLFHSTPPAQASYSSYSHREEDWKTRVDRNTIQYSTAKSLRSQLKEIVPENSEGSKIFCPNGPTANVSPLMENKCSDELAQPSIYGRTQDVVGNSIPGAYNKNKKRV